jgi:hypothetical protein
MSEMERKKPIRHDGTDPFGLIKSSNRTRRYAEEGNGGYGTSTPSSSYGNTANVVASGPCDCRFYDKDILFNYKL